MTSAASSRARATWPPTSTSSAGRWTGLEALPALERVAAVGELLDAAAALLTGSRRIELATGVDPLEVAAELERDAYLVLSSLVRGFGKKTVGAPGHATASQPPTPRPATSSEEVRLKPSAQRTRADVTTGASRHTRPACRQVLTAFARVTQSGSTVYRAANVPLVARGP
jgi:hypothetical protein